MPRFAGLLVLALAAAVPAAAQSLHLNAGTSGIEGSVGWSVGPSSNGVEGHVGVSINGRADVGLGFNHYTLDFGDGSEASFDEYAPFVRWFPVKETEGPPVSLSVNGQVFIDDYGTDDSGNYVQVGTTIYKKFELGAGFSVQPFFGFAFVAESYTFGGDNEKAQYLTRDLGLHFTTRTDRSWFLRFTLLDQSFRRETYRGARIAFVKTIG